MTMDIPFWTAEGTIDLANLKPEDLDPEFIGLTLAKINRFNGRTFVPWSVAQHSVLVAHLVPENRRAWALLHDTHEAFIGDLTNPAVDFICSCGTESAVRNAIANAKGKLDRVIGAAYSVAPVAMCSEIRAADHIALVAEGAAFLGVKPADEAMVHSDSFRVALSLISELSGDWAEAAVHWIETAKHFEALGLMSLPKPTTPSSMMLAG